MSRATPKIVKQLGQKITEGKEVEGQQKEMMQAEAKRRLIMSGKKK